MTRLALEQVTDFGDFTKGKNLKEFFKQAYSNISSQNCLSDVRLSPDGRHIHVIVRQPKSGLMTHDKYQRAHLMQCQKHVDLVLTGNVPIVDVIYIPQSKPEDGASVLGVIFENGRVEFWKFLECRSGWHLLQTVDLCKSPRAKVISVCMCQNFIIWCEERPPSENSNSVSSNLRFCICKKTIEVNEGGVSLGNVKIALHNNPQYTIISSGDLVYLLPDMRENRVSCKVFLAWSPEHDSFKVHSACSCTLMKSSSKESDFKRLVTDCIGLLFTINPPDICGFSPTGCGDLLLLLSTGWVCIMKRDGSLHNIYKLPDNCLSASGSQNSLNIYNEILALTIGRTLFLIDTKCGLELERISLKTEGLLFVNTLDSHSPQMLSETGLFVVIQNMKPSPMLSEDSSVLLVEAVFEEACKYYQQRSLSSTQLTVEKLKNGGMFQAPISLAAILRDYLSNQKTKTGEKHSTGQERLMSSLESELRSLVLLEDIKTSVVKASEKDLENHCESLVQQEICRLLSGELERENLQYLNSIFHLFPTYSWHAMQAVLHLRCNGEGLLSSKAPAELWKIILSPVQPTANLAHCNGQQKHTAVPVFELLCHSIFKFQPSWLPRILELAQQQSGGSSKSSWGYGMKESSESLPLYKRALTVLPCNGTYQHLKVELLLCSERPKAIMQALQILIKQGQWEQVAQAAERFCRQSPLLNKEIFSALLCEVSQHRDLDPYLDLLWTLCPEDMTVTSILNIVLKDLPDLTQNSRPFEAHGSQVTIRLLKPLLRKVLQRETKPSQRYADILQSPTVPPLTPPRQPKGLFRDAEQKETKQRTSSGSQATCQARLMCPFYSHHTKACCHPDPNVRSEMTNTFIL
ncbi:Hermansky-Pudlak syndrome 6 protein homolog isoform X1 [Sinocyclocheilus grahami]|uniref:Hermansky-Pudlak syndrome 6 protein homolog isoform X1 n=1 Tax=Sinocyclocheilus grahami TaxID=75366 RepID=UPI0007AC98DA|nr:PREDICTED: Hermansky-Pudlak syndrome 6 protein homolog isoform X1 [Sinocyclocheilus grahami]